MPQSNQIPKGVIVPIITPLTRDENIDEISLRKCVRHLIKGGVHGIFVNSTTGEGLSLLDDQKRLVLEIVIDETNRMVPVYAGVSDTSLGRALRNLAETVELGADVAVAHPPFYYPPNSQEELLTFFQSLTDHSPIPLMLYNIPSTTKAHIELDTVRILMENDNIIGIKDSSVDYVFLLNLIELKKYRPDFSIFIGKSHLWTGGIFSGADGGLDGISNLIPDLCVQLYNTITEGRFSDAVALQQRINEIWRVYECRSFLAGIKMAMSLRGLCEPWTTKPILMTSEEEQERIINILREYGLLENKGVRK